MEINFFKNQDAAEWNCIVQKSPHGTIFHSWAWLKIIEQHTASRLYPLAVYEGKSLIGIIPLFFQKKFGIKFVFSPPPQTALYYLGPVLIDWDEKKQYRKEREFLNFQRTIDSFIVNDLKANYISISLPPDLYDPRPFKWTGYTVYPLFDYILVLDGGIDHQWHKIPGKVRQNINRARLRGVSTTEGDRKDFIEIIDLMNRRYSEQGRLEKVSKAYLLDVFDAFRDNIKIFTATYNDEIVTGVIDLIYRNQMFSWIGNPKPAIQVHPSPNDMMIWEEIKYGCSHGMQRYVTMSAAGNERLHSYYSSKMHSVLSVRYSAKKHSWIAGKLENLYSGILRPIHEKLHTFDLL